MPDAGGDPADVLATRLAYDTVAEDYAELLQAELANKPYDRAMLATFAELVKSAGGGRVGDLGCGPGRVTAHLDSLGLDAFGVDLSPGMVAVARQRHPTLEFDVGSIEALPLPDGALAGALAWYSIIHTPPRLLQVVFAECARVLAPAGMLLLAFQAVAEDSSRGPEPRHLAHAYGHDIDLDAYLLPPADVAAALGDAGLTVQATLIREPDAGERTRQAFLLASRP